MDVFYLDINFFVIKLIKKVKKIKKIFSPNFYVFFKSVSESTYLSGIFNTKKAFF